MKKIFIFYFLISACSNSIKPISKDLTSVHLLEEVLIQSDCPQGMNHVSGEYCPQYELKCKKWLDTQQPAKKGWERRCQEYYPPVCHASFNLVMDFCIDSFEYPETNLSTSLPKTNVNYLEAQKLCQEQNKKLCTNEQWEFACSGEKINAYPIGNVRNEKICYHNQTQLIDIRGNLKDLRESIFTHNQCISDFGVHNMTGNVDEWVDLGNKIFPRSGLMGGWWNIGIRSRCSAITSGHNEIFKQISVGFRCCQTK